MPTILKSVAFHLAVVIVIRSVRRRGAFGQLGSSPGPVPAAFFAGHGELVRGTGRQASDRLPWHRRDRRLGGQLGAGAVVDAHLVAGHRAESARAVPGEGDRGLGLAVPARPVGARGQRDGDRCVVTLDQATLLPTWSNAATFSGDGAVIGIEFPVSRVAVSEGRSPEMTGEPSVVKNTWPLLVTVTALASVGAALGAPAPGPARGSGRSVSAAPILNGTLSLAPAIERTSKVYVDGRVEPGQGGLGGADADPQTGAGLVSGGVGGAIASTL